MHNGETGSGDPLERLKAGASAYRRPRKKKDCPAEDRLRLLLPGQIGPEEAERLLTHAAECDWCGMILRQATEDLTEPLKPDEEELAGKSRLADPLARRALVERIVKPKRPWAPILRWSPAAGLAFAALVGVVGYPQWARSPAHTEQLLAEAYTSNRQMEPRFPGAAWSPERTELGAGGSSVNKPPELRDAESNIARATANHTEDPRWLELQGLQDVLEGSYEPAVSELARAHALRPNSASILLDWGIALFEEGEAKDDAKLRAEGLERFSEGCRLKPKDPELLFNRALAAQKQFLYNEALDDWNAYLKVDSSSGWAREARAHLDEVKKNLSGSAPTPPPPPPRL